MALKKKVGRGKKGSGPVIPALSGKLRDDEHAFCNEIAQGISVREASRNRGWESTYGYKVLKRPRVEQYIKKLTEEIKRKEIKKNSDEIAKQRKVDRSHVLERLGQLMDMPPEETNGTITGQVKAGESLAKILGMMVERTADMTKMFENKSEEELDYYAIHGVFPNEHGNASHSGDGGDAGPSPDAPEA
jgi:hypothetical protein